ncbi:MAG: AAA family ATPase [Nitrososphaerales archaeon]
MRNCVGITGTPGTGKKTLAPLVASKIGIPCVSLYDQAVASGLIKKDDPEAEVDTAALGKFLVRQVSKPALIYGHLLPYVLMGQEIGRVAVLRCEPRTLKRRLLARAYDLEKVAENVEAELIGVVSADSITAFGRQKAAEFDATKVRPTEMATAVAGFLSGSRRPGPRIDWTFRYGSAAKLRSLLSVRSMEPNLA